MTEIYFASHPDVLIDKSIDITKWKLSEKGVVRMQKLIEESWIKSIEVVYSSEETKAVEAAEIVAKVIDKKVIKFFELGEIDRSSTGFLERELFEKAVDCFFGSPKSSYKGWETAVNAQKRIVDIIFKKIVPEALGNKNILIMSHGGVGALLISYLTGREISRKEDQPFQGHYFCFSSTNNRMIHGWKPF